MNNEEKHGEKLPKGKKGRTESHNEPKGDGTVIVHRRIQC